MKRILFITTLMFASALAAQTKDSEPIARPLTERELAIREIDYTLEKTTVLENLRKCALAVSRGEGKGKPLPRVKYVPYKSRMEKFLKYKWFIADTGLSRKWFEDVYKLFSYMYKTRDIIEASIQNKQTHRPESQQAVKYYGVAYQRFVKLVEKPVEVSGKLRRQSQLQKVLWQKAMRKKYKLKQKY